MPSFLQKVFGRKKEDGSDSSKPLSSRKSNPSLLEGKFEAIVPPPVVTTDEQSSPKETGFGLFRTKSRSAKSPASPVPRIEDLPSLSLNLPGQRDENGSRALGVVFEGDRDVVLEDSVIGSKRLNPTETIALVKACSQVITERGMSTFSLFSIVELTLFKASKHSGSCIPTGTPPPPKSSVGSYHSLFNLFPLKSPPQPLSRLN